MEQISATSYLKGIVRWALVLSVVCLLVVAFGSPIFRILGFEYSAISALLLSLTIGFRSAAVSSSDRSTFYHNLIAGLGLWLVPLTLSTLSLLFISNCSYWEGLLFYLKVALPTTLLAVVFGTAIGVLSRSRRRAVLLFGLFWILSFILSLLPGYFFPQLFTYGWQYGFFPGLVWDEYIELGRGYAWHLAEWGLLATIMIVISTPRQRSLTWWSRIGMMLAVYAALWHFRSENRVTTSHATVEDELSSTLLADNALIHFEGASLTTEEQQLLIKDVTWYVHDIRDRLALQDTTAIDIYLYPDVESLYRLVGTRSASIAKPWLSELHIAKENLHSLRHELVHVLLREWGSFPFYASWSTGMTEGVAMAIEPSYDGMHTLHEHASAILRTKRSEGVQRVISFTGFASGASTTSYVLAGSFAKYLLEHYPPQEFARAYLTLDFEESYGRNLVALESEWKKLIQPLSAHMDRYDSLRTEFYFQRSSIIDQPCLRRIGRLSRKAQLAYKDHRYEESEQLYREIFNESRSVSSFRGVLNSLARRGKIDSARSLLAADKLTAHPQRLSLYMMKGDLINAVYYDTLIATELSSGSVLTAYARKHLPFRELYLHQLYTFSSPLSSIPLDMTETAQSGPAPYGYVSDYLTASAYESEGLYSHAMFYYDRALKVVNADTSATAIKWPLILNAMSLDPSYDPHELPTRPAWIAEYNDRLRKVQFFRERSANSQHVREVIR